MAKKKVKSDFEDMKNKIDESFEFDDEDFGDIEEKKQQLSRNKNTGHKIFFIAVGVVLLICVISLLIWNKGQRIHIDPNEDTSEFDTEPNDYIQPLTNEQMQGKPDDGILTILTLGNSPFADNGDGNYLCSELYLYDFLHSYLVLLFLKPSQYLYQLLQEILQVNTLYLFLLV